MKMAWTEQMVEDLRTMWKQGLTTAEIGKRLNVTKNSIVGKVHRLGLSGRPSPIKKKNEENAAEEIQAAENVQVVSSKNTAESPQLKKETVKIDKAQMPEVKPVMTSSVKSEPAKKGMMSLMDLDNHTCRWPLGDPKDENFHFCGRKVKIGQTYCEEHANIAYVKAVKK